MPDEHSLEAAAAAFFARERQGEKERAMADGPRMTASHPLLRELLSSPQLVALTRYLRQELADYLSRRCVDQLRRERGEAVDRIAHAVLTQLGPVIEHCRQLVDRSAKLEAERDRLQQQVRELTRQSPRRERLRRVYVRKETTDGTTDGTAGDAAGGAGEGGEE